MIYKQKGDLSVEALRTIPELKGVEFPVVITADKNITYLEVWEVEEFDPETLSVKIEGMKGQVLLKGEIEVEG